LVDARDGSERSSDVANQAEITTAEAIGPTLEGKAAINVLLRRLGYVKEIIGSDKSPLLSTAPRT
jgi:hypothetical protein